MKNRPSACETVSYVVPDGSWTATIAAPGITAPWASRTTPVIEAVVTPCAASVPALRAHANNAATAQTIRDLIGQFIASSRLKRCLRQAILACVRKHGGDKKAAGRRRRPSIQIFVAACRAA